MVPFFFTGGTLRADAQSYVERRADRELIGGLLKGDYSYVLTSRQMGKSSLMVRTARRLREQGVEVVVLDLTAIGLNVSPEQWYDGLVARIGNQLQLEEELEDFWLENRNIGPLQRVLESISQIILPNLKTRTNRSPDGARAVFFIDEIDVVRSLPFSTDELFSGIRECYNRRAMDAEWNRITFCLLGAATPADLIRDIRITPFNVGHRIELTDFTEKESKALEQGLAAALASNRCTNSPGGPLPADAKRLLARILHWTHGHPYLTQRLCRSISEIEPAMHSELSEEQLVDRFCDELFLSNQAREKDDNLLYVRDRLLRTNKDLGGVFDIYERALRDEPVPVEENNPLLDELKLAGIVDCESGRVQVRNRIYRHVFDINWVKINRPDAILVRENGERIPLKTLCNIGRAPANELVLQSEKVSRRHAQIQMQQGGEFWLVDLGSSNGTYLNGRRVVAPVLLQDQDIIDIGQLRFVFRQDRGPRGGAAKRPPADATVMDTVITYKRNPGEPQNPG